jgi:predicted TIM-barrel fold metal-dependent hydrolase
MARAYRCISSDSHMEISPNMWRDRVPAALRDRAPRTIRLPNGGDAIIAENQPMRPVWAHNVPIPFEDMGPDVPDTFEGKAGAGGSEQRLREQDVDGVDAEVLFPGVSGQEMWNHIPDDAVYNAIVRAYNDFLTEDFMSLDRDRLLCMGIMPARGIDDALSELERCAKLGFKGVVLATYPSGKVRPSTDDDRFWARALDLKMPVTIHTQFLQQRSERRGGAAERGFDLARRISTYGVKAAPIAAAFALEGVFDRFPDLHIFIAENQISWIPGWLEQMDILWGRHRFYHERLQPLKPISRPPAECVKAHFSWGFMDNPVGVQMRHYIGVDKVMWSTDFPHDPSDWPHSQETIARQFAGIPEDEKYAMIAGNAVRFFHLDALPLEQEAKEAAQVA